jgi:hypothetical protein
MNEDVARSVVDTPPVAGILTRTRPAGRRLFPIDPKNIATGQSGPLLVCNEVRARKHDELERHVGPLVGLGTSRWRGRGRAGMRKRHGRQDDDVEPHFGRNGRKLERHVDDG